MCWAIRIAGEFVGMPDKNTLMASVPPVEDPTTMMR
jgi:hypothetical protein